MKLCSKERVLVFDSEANGLLNEATKMWCVVAQDYHTREMFLFHDYPEYDGYEGLDDLGEVFKLQERNGSLEQGVVFLHKAKGLIAHNCLGYDFELMRKFYPKFKVRYDYPNIRDTLIESQVQWYDRPAVKGYKGIHGLAVYGARFGIRKPEIEDWSFMDAEKLHRCLEDVKINTEVALFLEKERAMIEEKCNGITFDKALETEHEYRYWSTIQELNGALVDVPHMERCIVDLDKKLEKLKEVIEPQLPPTLKVKNPKATSHSVAKELGMKRLPPIKYEMRQRKGEWLEYEIKTMHKTTMKWTNVSKQKMYSVVDKVTEEEYSSHSFKKLKEARDWAKKNYPDVKKFIFPSIEVETEEYDAHCLTHFGEAIANGTEIVGPHVKVEFSQSTMSQHDKVKKLLVGLGWYTDEWTYKKNSEGGLERAEQAGVVYWPDHAINGNQLSTTYQKGGLIPVTPKLSEDSYDTLPEGVGETIGHYNTYSHRRKFIKNPDKDDKGLLNNLREDGRITGGLRTFGTTAGRAAQYGWVNAPSVQALYGEEIRNIVIAPEGCSLLGVDMPSAHPRLLADFTQNDLFISAVDGDEELEDGTYVGEDFHTVNSILFGLNTKEAVEAAKGTKDHDLRVPLDAGRKKGKGGSYCTLYGGSAKKLETSVGAPEGTGQKLKDDFLNGLGLDLLLAEVMETWELQKRANSWKQKITKNTGSYMQVLGGYYVYCNSLHKIINYKALGSEAVMQKVAVNLLCRKLRDLGLKTKLILNVHDEVLLEVPNEELDTVRPLAANMYVEAAHELGLTLDWSSVAKVGQTYAKCH